MTSSDRDSHLDQVSYVGDHLGVGKMNRAGGVLEAESANLAAFAWEAENANHCSSVRSSCVPHETRPGSAVYGQRSL